MLENSQPVLNSPKRSAQHQQQCKRACSPTWLSFFIAAAAFLILAGAAVGIAFVTKAADDESFRNTFNRYAISQTQRIRNSLSTIEQKLSVVAEALEALPSRGLTRERVFGILATGGAVPASLPVLFQWTREYGLDPSTFNYTTLARTTESQLVYEPMNFSNPEAYVVAHTSRIPPSMPPEEAAAISSLLLDIYTDPSDIAMIDESLRRNQVVARAPRLVPSGVEGIPVAAPIYYRPWSESEISNATNYRGFALISIWNSSLIEAVDLPFPNTFALTDLASGRVFISTYTLQPPVHEEVQGEVLEYHSNFMAFSREYRISVFPTEGFITENDDGSFLAVLLPLLAAAILISVAVFFTLWSCFQRTKGRLRLSQMEEREKASVLAREAEARAHERVLGYVHHEVRNPLNVIMGTVELIKANLQAVVKPISPLPGRSEGNEAPLSWPSTASPSSSTSPPGSFPSCDVSKAGGPTAARKGCDTIPHKAVQKILKRLEFLQSAGHQMEQHVNDMLDLERLRKGELVLNPKATDITAVLRSIVNFYQPRSRVPLHLETPSMFGLSGSFSECCLVVVDETRIRQIVTNALLNAIKHTSQGEISLSFNILTNSTGDDALEEIRDLMSRRRKRHRRRPSNPNQEGDDQLSGSPTVRQARCGSHTSVISGVSTGLDPGPWDLQEASIAALVLKINDTGTGLGGTQPSALFEDFVSIKREGHGRVSNAHQSGLGLSICALLSESMGGGVDLVDTGNGCLFTCVVPVELRCLKSQVREEKGGDVVPTTPAVLPTTRTAAVEISTDTQTAAPSYNFYGLIVDDDPTNVKLVARMLRGMGVTSQGISTGDIPCAVEEALKNHGLLEDPPIDDHQPYDFFLLDIRLGPTLSGVDILHLIRPRLKRFLPVFAMTANTRSSDVQEYREAGFSGLVSKPVTKQKLASMLQRVSAVHEGTLRDKWLSPRNEG